MKVRNTLLLSGILMLAMEAVAASTSDELWIIAAGRGSGAAGSNWVTDLVVTNSGEESVEVEIAFVGNPAAVPFRITIDAAQSVSFPDVLQSRFGVSAGAGALHVEAVDEGEEDDSGLDVIQLRPREDLPAGCRRHVRAVAQWHGRRGRDLGGWRGGERGGRRGGRRRHIPHELVRRERG